MKMAKDQDGKLIEASETSPPVAICPHCGGEVTLRSRSTMDGGKKSYYWRHRSNQNRNCSGRTRVV